MLTEDPTRANARREKQLPKVENCNADKDDPKRAAERRLMLLATYTNDITVRAPPIWPPDPALKELPVRATLRNDKVLPR